MATSHMDTPPADQVDHPDWPLQLDLVFALHVLTEPDPRRPNYSSISAKMGRWYTDQRLKLHMTKLKDDIYFLNRTKEAERLARFYCPPENAPQAPPAEQSATRRPSDADGPGASAVGGAVLVEPMANPSQMQNAGVQSSTNAGNHGQRRNRRRNRNRNPNPPNQQAVPRISTQQRHGFEANRPGNPPSSGGRRVDQISRPANSNARSQNQNSLAVQASGVTGAPNRPNFSASSSSSSTTPGPRPMSHNLHTRGGAANPSQNGRQRDVTEETVQPEDSESDSNGNGRINSIEEECYPDGDPGSSNSLGKRKGEKDKGKKKRKRSDSTGGDKSARRKKCNTCRRNCVCGRAATTATPGP